MDRSLRLLPPSALALARTFPCYSYARCGGFRPQPCHRRGHSGGRA